VQQKEAISVQSEDVSETEAPQSDESDKEGIEPMLTDTPLPGSNYSYTKLNIYLTGIR